MICVKRNLHLDSRDRLKRFNCFNVCCLAQSIKKSNDKRLGLGALFFRMQNVIKCSFCQKPQGMVRDEVASARTLTVSICQDCLNICRGILKKETSSVAKSGRYRISSPRQDRVGPLCCSFCDTPQQIVDKLIGSPPSVKPAYICDKCVADGVTTVVKRSPKNFWHWLARKVGIHNSLFRHAPGY